MMKTIKFIFYDDTLWVFKYYGTGNAGSSRISYPIGSRMEMSSYLHRWINENHLDILAHSIDVQIQHKDGIYHPNI